MKICKKLLTIVTEGGKEFGFGHLTRSLSIATSFEKYGFSSQWLINGDASIKNLLQIESCPIVNWLIDINKLCLLVEKSTLILIDSILITNEQILKLESLGIPIIFIDDERRRNILNKGIVIDWTILSDQKDYFFPQKKDVTYLLGSLYTPLRQDFYNSQQKIISKNIQEIMISFGGSDVRNLTPVVLKTLIKHFPNYQKNIIIGAGFQNIQDIINIQDKNTKLYIQPTVNEIVQIMYKSDLAIASGGQTLYELAHIGTPTIATLLIDNAKDDTEGWAKVGFIKNIGWWHSEDLLPTLIEAINTLKDYQIRLEMQQSTKNYIQQNGADNLIKAILRAIK